MSPSELLQLEAEARYYRDRLALYRARMHTGRLADASRMRELERLSLSAETRLRTARTTVPSPPTIADHVREAIARNDAERARRLHLTHPDPPAADA